MQHFKEIIDCADGGPTPPPGYGPDAWYVGVYSKECGTLFYAFYNNEEIARLAFDGLVLPVGG